MNKVKLENTILIPYGKTKSGVVRIPGSKSLSNRALILAALSDGVCQLDHLLDSDDTRLMIQALKNIGVSVKRHKDSIVLMGKQGAFSTCKNDIYCENAGTVMRFLCAVLVLGKGQYRLVGNDRMHERPIGDLISSLQELGCQITSENNNSAPPVTIVSTPLIGGDVEISGEVSSQFLSALMMISPFASRDVNISIKGELVSRTYVDMTAQMMNHFGVTCAWVNSSTITVPAGQRYRASNYHVEGDASSASYFFALAAITNSTIEIVGLNKNSLQGDLKLLDILEAMGTSVVWKENSIVVTGRRLRAVDVDMNFMSDVAPTLAVVALFAKGKTTVRNVENMRFKECDRIKAICRELSKIGAKIEEHRSGFSVYGQCTLNGMALETYNDHRMAMAFSLIGTRVRGISIINPNCVSKTYPHYFDHLFSFMNE